MSIFGPVRTYVRCAKAIPSTTVYDLAPFRGSGEKKVDQLGQTILSVLPACCVEYVYLFRLSRKRTSVMNGLYSHTIRTLPGCS